MMLFQKGYYYRQQLQFSCQYIIRYVSSAVLDNTTSYLRNINNGAEIFLIGTAHISEKSAQQVEETIRLIKPSTVMVELDAKRAQHLLSNQQRPDPILSALNRLFSGAAFNLTGELFRTGVENMYNYLKKMGLQPGKEMKVAMVQAQASGAKIVYGDKEIESTIASIAKHVSIFDLPKLFMGGNLQRQVDPELAQVMQQGGSLEGIAEALKNRRYARLMIDSMRGISPGIITALIDERDQHMTEILSKLEGRVVAVVGLAHMDGIERRWEKLTGPQKKLYP